MFEVTSQGTPLALIRSSGLFPHMVPNRGHRVSGEAHSRLA